MFLLKINKTNFFFLKNMSYKQIIKFNLILTWFLYTLFFSTFIKEHYLFQTLLLFLYFSICLFSIYFAFKKHFQYILTFILLVVMIWLFQYHWLDYFTNTFHPATHWWIKNPEIFNSINIMIVSLSLLIINFSTIIASFYEKKEELKNNQNLE